MPTQPPNPKIFPHYSSKKSEDSVTLRDVFAGLALISLSTKSFQDLTGRTRPYEEVLAEVVYSIADAMLAARLKPQS